MSADQQDMNHAARRAVEDNARHSSESLFELLCRWFPEATEAQIDEAVEHGLDGGFA